MHSKYWMPLVWAGAIVKKARKENRICNDAMLLAMVNEINRIRSVSGDLLNYDWVNIPLVYTQVRISYSNPEPILTLPMKIYKTIHELSKFFPDFCSLMAHVPVILEL